MKENVWDSWHRTRDALCSSEDLARFISKLPEGSRILDVGCGFGDLLIFLKQLRQNYKGVGWNGTFYHESKTYKLEIIEDNDE